MKTVKPQTGIKGIDIVISNLQRELVKIKDRSLQGMIYATMDMWSDMEPLVPIDTNNLRASWFWVTLRNSSPQEYAFKGDNAGEMSSNHQSVKSALSSSLPKKDPALFMGFSANYAMFVHEMVDAKFKRSGAEAKFFEKTLKAHKNRIIATIAKEAKIK